MEGAEGLRSGASSAGSLLRGNQGRCSQGLSRWLRQHPTAPARVRGAVDHVVHHDVALLHCPHASILLTRRMHCGYCGHSILSRGWPPPN